MANIVKLEGKFLQILFEDDSITKFLKSWIPRDVIVLSLVGHKFARSRR